jgi:hypothetical protein
VAEGSPAVVAGCVLVAEAQASAGRLGVRVAADQLASRFSGSGRAAAGLVVGRSPTIEEKARIMLATPVASSPAPIASLAAVSGLGSRIAEIARQTGQTQHSALPVAQLPP